MGKKKVHEYLFCIVVNAEPHSCSRSVENVKRETRQYILSNKRNAPNRKLNHNFSSTVKVFMNIGVRYIYDKTFESTIKLREF